MIIPSDVKPVLEFIADAEIRKALNIGVDSQWLFPSYGKSMIAY